MAVGGRLIIWSVWWDVGGARVVWMGASSEGMVRGGVGADVRG
jgi:hypothetical protein